MAVAAPDNQHIVQRLTSDSASNAGVAAGTLHLEAGPYGVADAAANRISGKTYTYVLKGNRRRLAYTSVV